MTQRTFTFNVTAPAAATWLNGKSLYEWVALDNISQRTSVNPVGYDTAHLSGGLRGYDNNRAVCNAWGGATLRPSGSWLLLNGGGHGDYYGNEVYGLQLSANNPQWERLWGPTPAAQTFPPTAGSSYYLDGNPRSAHTYYYLQYDTVNDRMMRVGSGDGASATKKVDGLPWTARGYGAAGTANGWLPAGTFPDSNYSSSDVCTAMNPTTGEVFIWNNSFRERLAPGASSWTVVPSSGSVTNNKAPMVYDPVTNGGCLWVIGGIYTRSGQVSKWIVSNNAASLETVTGNGLAVVSQTTSFDEPALQAGACYDPINACIWIYSRNVVYKFTPATMQINVHSMLNPSQGPLAQYGVEYTFNYGRTQYVPELKGVVIQPAWSAPTFFFRTSL